MGSEAWLNILAAANKESPNKLIGINELLQKHYAKYGRSFFSRYDYEEVSSEGAHKLVAQLNEAIKTSSFANMTHRSKSTGQDYKIASVSNFSYTDPIDKSVSANQGQVVLFDDGSRVVFRLSGTGSAGATVRMYVERYVGPDAGEKELSRATAEGLKGLIEVALELTKLKEFLQRDEPTVITVRYRPVIPLHHRLTVWFSKYAIIERSGVSLWILDLYEWWSNQNVAFGSWSGAGGANRRSVPVSWRVFISDQSPSDSSVSTLICNPGDQESGPEAVRLGLLILCQRRTNEHLDCSGAAGITPDPRRRNFRVHESASSGLASWASNGPCLQSHHEEKGHEMLSTLRRRKGF